MEEKYRDFTIRFDEDKEKWEFVEDGFRDASLKKVKQRIDDLIKQKFQGKKVLYLDYNRELKEFTITNKGDSSNSEVEMFWIRDEDGKRRKISLEYCYQDTEFNRNIIKEMKELQGKQIEIRKQIEAKEKQLQKADSKEIGDSA